MKTQEEYLDEYISLMEVARNRPTPEGYTEKHHIFPKSWMPNDYIVVLTAQEHFIAHYLLSKAFSEDNKMSLAFWMMCNKVGTSKHERDYEVSAEIYAEARESVAKLQSETGSGENHPMFGKKHSKETRAKMSASRKTWKHSPEAIEKMRIGNLGKKVSVKSKAKMRAAKLGTSISSEHKANIRASMLGMKRTVRISTCVHCGKSGAVNLITRYHNDNCKLK